MKGHYSTLYCFLPDFSLNPFTRKGIPLDCSCRIPENPAEEILPAILSKM